MVRLVEEVVEGVFEARVYPGVQLREFVREHAPIACNEAGEDQKGTYLWVDQKGGWIERL
jgi:hypothetical protein